MQHFSSVVLHHPMSEGECRSTQMRFHEQVQLDAGLLVVLLLLHPVVQSPGSPGRPASSCTCSCDRIYTQHMIDTPSFVLV